MRGRLAAGLPAALVAALVLVGAPGQLSRAWQRLSASPRGLARDAAAARLELRGETYDRAVSQIERRVPAGGAYALAGEGGPGNVKHSLRCDLAPRTPIRLLPEKCGGWLPDRSFAKVPDVAVLLSADGTPRVVETRAILSTHWSGLSGPREDIPGWLDAPGEGATVAGPVVVSGWCQERGGRPCVAVRVWVDGVEVDAARIERFPRPELGAAVPGIGDTSRAGWRVPFAPGALAPGTHCVAAALVASGGRHRRVGPWPFTVAP